MTSFKKVSQPHLLLAIICNCIIMPFAFSQQPAEKNKQYQLNIHFVDKDTSFNAQALKLQTTFTNSIQCHTYINNLPALLSTKGYPTASVDSVWEDTASAGVKLFLGKQYQWIKMVPDGIEKAAMDESGFREKDYKGKLLNIQQLLGLQQKILDYYEKKWLSVC